MATQRRGITTRLQRFHLEKPLSVICKNARSRYTCFWLDLANVSASGVGLAYAGNGFIPYSIDDVLHLTVDLTSMVFSRPIHLIVSVKRREETERILDGKVVHGVFLGAKIEEFDQLHQTAWLEGLQKLGDPFKEDTVSPQKRVGVSVDDDDDFAQSS